MYENVIRKLKIAKKIVIFTGAGISTESGIPDFRSDKGLYSEDEFSGYEPETILSRSFFQKFPDIFYRYYFSKIVHKDAKPNNGHLAIAAMESDNREITVVTQNIDGLHTAARSTNVLELHGSVHRNYCTKCGKKFNLDYVLRFKGEIPLCGYCNGIVRPDVTMYEEVLEQEVLANAVSRLADADFIFAIGSSLTVQPAAGLLSYFKGNDFAIINKQPTPYDKKADYVIRESCGNVLVELAGGING